MKVPFINLQEQVKNIRSEIIDNVTETIESGKFILGDKLFAFEKNISSYIGQESLGCASGTDALLMALMASSVGSGDEVITTPFTFFSTAGAIARLGAKPVFVDIDERTYNIDPALIEEKITPNTKAIIPVHLFGQPANMIEINKIAKRNNLIVIEDACQAIGAKYDGVNVGLLGDFACFSFFPTKNLGVAGDGGLITCKKQFDFDYLKKLRVHGSSKKYFHDFVGINSRLDALNAGILDIKLKYLDKWNARRIEIASNYSSVLKEFVVIPYDDPLATHVFHQYAILTDKRDDLLAYLKGKDIAVGIYYPLPLHLQESFSYLGYKKGDFSVSERVSEKILSLPIFPEMTNKQVNYVIESIVGFFD